MSNPELIMNVRDAILKSGFPLEIEVLNICSTKNIGRIPSVRYVYDGQEHEIDLIVQIEQMIHRFSKGENFQYTKSIMIIECKKSDDKPWVFFCSPDYQEEPWAGNVTYLSDFNLYFSKAHRHSLLGQIFKNLKRNHYNDTSIPLSTGYHEPFKSHDAKSEIYRAVESVLTFLSYACENESSKLTISGSETTFYFPVIVFDGILFEAMVTPEGLDLHERQHILYRARREDSSLMVDVVTKSYFPKFLDMVEEDNREYVKCINMLQFPKAHKSVITRSHGLKVRRRQKQREEGIDFLILHRDPATGRVVYGT
jgi:hypothetical protein